MSDIREKKTLSASRCFDPLYPLPFASHKAISLIHFPVSSPISSFVLLYVFYSSYESLRVVFFSLVFVSNNSLATCLTLPFFVFSSCRLLLTYSRYLWERKLHSLHALLYFTSFVEEHFPFRNAEIKQHLWRNAQLSEEVCDSSIVSGWTFL